MPIVRYFSWLRIFNFAAGALDADTKAFDSQKARATIGHRMHLS